jgi:general secretion pathway protein I
MWRSTGLPAGSRSRTERFRTGAAGFTLVEVLIAFVILALALAALLPSFASGLRGLEATDEHVAAALFAESKLAAVGREAPLEQGTTSGELPSGLRWRLDVRALDELDPEQTLPVRAYQVVLSVSWVARGSERLVTFETLRLGPPLDPSAP